MIRRVWRAFWRLMGWLVRLSLLLFMLNYSTPPPGDPAAVIGRLAGSALFDFIVWEASALLAKARETLYGVHPFMDEAARSAFVEQYMIDLARAQALDNAIVEVYSRTEVTEAAEASAELRQQRDALRADLLARQGTAEAILEGQVASVLIEEGFGVGGQLLPPIAMRFTEMPSFLVVSPRDRIEFRYGFALNPLAVDAQAALEERVEAAQEVSALIVPLGGIAVYPAMILERTSIAASLDTFAHEWLHHYLLFFPLGFNYDFGNETRIINETTAVLFGREVSRRVLERYYPHLLQASALRLRPLPSLLLPAAQPAFDYGAEMHRTRLRVDALLAAGEIVRAEAYMERRRQAFVANGYLIRRMNQAFFAFYGGYQSGGQGAGGADPVGAAVAALREDSAGLHDWIITMRDITTRTQLLSLVEGMR
jgi:hypothetical protein